MKARLVSIFAVLIFAAESAFAADVPLTDAQKSCLAKANRHERAGWIYLHIEGAPREMGFQHGHLLAAEIADGLRIQRRLWEYTSGMPWNWMVTNVNTMFAGKVDAELVAEIDGIVEGMKAAGKQTTREEMIAFNAYFELDWYWWPKKKKEMGSPDLPVAPKQSCSSFIATGRMTRDGNVVLGHNSMVDFPEARFNVVMDLVPQRGARILMQTWPGWIHSGTDFFVTGAGLVGSETTIGGFDGFDEKGLPEFVRVRRAMQDARSIDEWCDIMKTGNNGGYANSWLVGDINTKEIARLELGLKQVGFERTKDGFFVGCNIAENIRLLRHETDVNENDIRLSSIARRVRWKELMARHAGGIDAGLARTFEADHWDAFHKKSVPGSRSLCGHFELDATNWGNWPGAPYYPAGTIDGKVVDAAMARQMSFAGRWGSACGKPFSAAKFLKEHPQFDWMKDLITDRPSQPWAVFKAGEK